MGDAGAAVQAQQNFEREAGQVQNDAYSKAIETLGKTRDQLISESELAQLKAENKISETEAKQVQQYMGFLQKTQQSLTDAERRSIETTTGLEIDASGILTQSQQDALSTLKGGTGDARRDIQEGLDTGLGALAKGFEGAQSQLQQTKLDASGQLKSQFGKAGEAITQAGDQATAQQQPFIQAGQEAVERERVLSGLATPEEIAAYNERTGGIEASPLFKMQLQEGIKQLGRGQQARGEFFSGAALEQERKLAQDLSAQEAQRQLSNLQPTLNRGAQASNTAGQAALQTGTSQADLFRQLGLGDANLTSGIGQQISNLLQQGGTQQAGLAQSAADSLGRFGQQGAFQEANTQSQGGQLLASLLERIRREQAGTQLGVGQEQAGLNSRAGSDLASIAGSSGGTQADIGLKGSEQRQGIISGFGTGKANALNKRGLEQGEVFRRLGSLEAEKIQARDPSDLIMKSLTGFNAEAGLKILSGL